jgi:Domain of unknown function (DUF4386)
VIDPVGDLGAGLEAELVQNATDVTVHGTLRNDQTRPNLDISQGLAFGSADIDTAAFQLNLVFFGLLGVLTGYLICRSSFLPRLIGAALMLDGLGWTLYVWPPLALSLFPIIAVVAGVAEFSLEIWLIVFGVHEDRWRARDLALNSAAS